jgi:hypothetical protein
VPQGESPGRPGIPHTVPVRLPRDSRRSYQSELAPDLRRRVARAILRETLRKAVAPPSRESDSGREHARDPQDQPTPDSRPARYAPPGAWNPKHQSKGDGSVFAQCRLGDQVKGQRPDHDRPVWVTVVAKGQHGVVGEDSDGQRHRIREEDLHALRPQVREHEHGGAVVALHKMGAQVPAESTADRDAPVVQDWLARQGAPADHEVVRGDHVARDEAFESLRRMGAGVSPEDYAHPSATGHAPGDRLRALVDEAVAGGAPFDPDKLCTFPPEVVEETLRRWYGTRGRPGARR